MNIPLHIEQHLRQMAATEATLNCYLYDTTSMREKIVYLNNIMPAGVEVFYPMKANPHPAFLLAARRRRAGWAQC